MGLKLTPKKKTIFEKSSLIRVKYIFTIHLPNLLFTNLLFTNCNKYHPSLLVLLWWQNLIFIRKSLSSVMLLNNLPVGSTLLNLLEKTKTNSHFWVLNVACVYFSYLFLLHECSYFLPILLDILKLQKSGTKSYLTLFFILMLLVAFLSLDSVSNVGLLNFEVILSFEK